MEKYDFTIVSSCSKTKCEEAKTHPVPANELYIGSIAKIKRRICELLVDKHYYISPMGIGLVPKNHMAKWYDSNDSPELKTLINDPEYIKKIRDDAIKNDPDIIKYKTIYYIGNSRYLELVKKALKGQEVKLLLGAKYRIFNMVNIINNTLALFRHEYNVIDAHDIDDNKKHLKLRSIKDSNLVINIITDNNLNFIKMFNIKDIKESAEFKKYLNESDYSGGNYKKYLDKYKRKIRNKELPSRNPSYELNLNVDDILNICTYDETIKNRIKELYRYEKND